MEKLEKLGIDRIIVEKYKKVKNWEMNRYKKHFSKALKNHFPTTENALMSTLEADYKAISKDTHFATSSSNPIDKRLDFLCLFFSID